MRGGINAISVEMDVGEADSRAGFYQLAGLGVENVGIAANFVDWPPAHPETAASIVGFGHRHNRVVENEQAADGAARGLGMRVVYFFDLDGRDVAVFGQT